MTFYIALGANRAWESEAPEAAPPYQEKIFRGSGDIPLFGLVAIPQNPHSTVIATYGITGTLENQWYLRVFGRKAFAQGYAVILFDWRAHGKSAALSPTLTSDGLYEGEDFVYIAAQAKEMDCPAPFWFAGYSLGGQLALWAVKVAQTLSTWAPNLDLQESEIGGGAVICPNLESNRSHSHLIRSPWGRFLERAIAKALKQLAWNVYRHYPESIDSQAIEQINSILDFDRELVIGTLGFATVKEYYEATSALELLPHLKKPTLILYACDDPMFDPLLVSDLQRACTENPVIDLILTKQGGHVGYLSNQASQAHYQDGDRWWAWNRVLAWCNQQNSTGN